MPKVWNGKAGYPTDYAVSYAREFRYDGARQRYLNRALDPATLAPLTGIGDAIWTDYDGDLPYGDYVAVGAVVNNWRSYEPGIGEVGPWTDAGDANTQYHHADHLGTLRLRTASSGAGDGTRVFSAFGEALSGPTPPDRYGYVGAHGYQAHGEFPFLHVGARYYDPASGRFLQRDPIGIGGGLNSYSYGDLNPLLNIDPDGLMAAVASSGVPVSILVTHGIVESAWGMLPDGFHRFFGGGGHIPVLDPGPAQDATLLTCNIASYAAGGAGGAPMLLAKLSRLRGFKGLNSNRYLRIGPGKVGGGWQDRIVIGGGPKRVHIPIHRPRPLQPGRGVGG